VAGLACSTVCAGYLLVLLHLSLMGRVTAGATVRLAPGEAVEPGAPVPYTYSVGALIYDGWRRGIECGAEKLSVVYSPVLPRVHVVSARPGLASARALWVEPDYWLRLVLAGAGMALGWGVERLWRRLQRRGGSLLPGLRRDEPY